MEQWEYKMIEYIPEILRGAKHMQLTIVDNGTPVGISEMKLNWIGECMLHSAEYMDYLNCLGSNGWELVEVNGNFTVFLLRRQIKYSSIDY